MSTNSFNFSTVAKDYLAKGFSVIPVAKNKQPFIKWEEFQKRHATEVEIDQWGKDYPDANIGIITGEISGIIVVDIEKGGSVEGLTPTVMVNTGGGGFHFYYKHPGYTIKNAVRVRDLTDIRGDGGYVIAPPSLHSSNNQYEWATSPDQADMADAPAWVLKPTAKAVHKVKDWQASFETENTKGSRNDASAKFAGKLLIELPPDTWEVAGWPALKDWNQRKNKPPLNEAELRRTWDSILSREAGKRGFETHSEAADAIDFKAFDDIIRKWLLISDDGLLKVLVASVIANRLNADPVWLFIVTSSGGTKTELLRGLNAVDGIYPLSDLTPSTFLSGDRNNKSGSLLFRLPTEVILTMKDFTTVLTMAHDKRHAILSQLREIYDGQFKKEFGTGESKNWEGKLGFIAGVTSVIDRHYGVYQTLGERFIQYRPVQPDPIKLSLKAIRNSGSEVQMRDEIQTAFAGFIEGVKIPEQPPEPPEDLEMRVAHLAAFCVRARSGVVRESYSSREIELIPEAELPTRLSKQLITLLQALSLVSGEFTESDYGLVYKVGMDTLPKNRRRVIQALAEADGAMETVDIATKIGYPTSTTRRILEDLHGLRLIDRESHGRGHADEWEMREDTRNLLRGCQPHQESLIDQEFFGHKGMIPENSEDTQ